MATQKQLDALRKGRAALARKRAAKKMTAQAPKTAKRTTTKKGLSGAERAPKVKTMSVAEGKRWHISDYPNFHSTGSVTGMRKQYYGKMALLVKCGDFIYNVTTAPEIYNAAR
jgi:hypothetical protein